MKRFLLSIIMVVMGLSAFSQSPSRLINLRPAYPLAIGEKTVDGVVISNNGLYMHDVLLDSLPDYEIGHIYEQTVRYTEAGYGFNVKADSLHSLNVVYSYEVNEPPAGAIEFNKSTGRFKYYPAEDDYRSFVVTFSATNGTESVSEDVEFNMMPKTPSEADAFSTPGTMPSADDYTIVAEASTTMFLNNEERTAYSVSISGKDVVFDDAVHNKVWGLSGREDIYELNIYAERLIIRSALRFPQTDITVYAKELIFEDQGNKVSSINTTPASIETLTDGEGLNGAKGGNISLYIRDLKGNMAKRLILNGAKGQSTNRNGTPGNGGSGGNLVSTVDVSAFCDLARGSGGVKYDVATDGSTQRGPIISYGKIGDNGRFCLSSDRSAYLHPYYIAAVMRHANDAFINNCTEYTLQVCEEYHALIDEYLNPSSGKEGGNGEVHEGVIVQVPSLFDDTESSDDEQDDDWDLIIDDDDNWAPESDINNRLELQNELLELDMMLFKLKQGLDYFGNPVGWVPLLSFEVMLANYNNEIDRAIPTLYMYYWLSRIDQTLQNKVKASEFAANATEDEIDKNQELLNSLTLEIPVLQDEADEINRTIEELTRRIEELQNQLMAQAIKNVKKRSWWQKLFGIGKVVANVVSAIPGWGTAVGTGINFALKAASTGAEYYTGVDYSSVMNSVSSKALKDTLFTSLSKNLTKAKTSVSNKDLNGLTSACSSIINTAAPLYKNLEEAYKILSKNSAPNNEIQAEYNRLIANSAEWNSMKAQVDELNEKKTALINHMNEVFANMTTTVSELSNDALALDAFRRDVFTGNSKRDLNAMIYLEKMERRAKDRLLLYDYYLRKAYEYRLLKPYEGEFNLVGMFERFEKLGIAVDSVVNADAYSALSSVFREVVSDMTDKIVREYSVNYPEQSAPITIVISKEQLNAINAEEGLTLNFHEMGIFASDEENVRIVDLGIQHIETHTEGRVGYSGYMDLNLTHSGVSVFRKNGNLHWFDHKARTSTNPHTWGIRYDAVSDESRNIQPSAASNSLLSSIIGNGNSNIMMFSRPSAWSDIALKKKVHTSGGADIVIDSLVLRLQYDFTRRPDNICNIDICANNGLLPYIACSEADINGRSKGNGRLYRSYRTSSQKVTFTAVDKYEAFQFVNWTDRMGNIVSDKTALTVSKSKDQFYTANYDYRGPILDVADTIRVSNAGGTCVVNVGNIGTDIVDMDWYVSDEKSTWAKLDGTTEGIGEGTFTVVCEANTTGKDRLDSLVITAPESYVLTKKIYILQTDNINNYTGENTDVSKLDNAIYINPLKTSKGGKIKTSINLKNAYAATAYIFDMVLPNGVSVATNDKGKYLDELSERHEDHMRTFNYKGNNTYSLSTLSGNSEALSGNDGAIRMVTLELSGDMQEGVYEILIKNASYSKTNGALVNLPETKATITVVNYMIGDVNGNGGVDIGDAVSIVNHLVGKESTNFVEKAADTNNNGQVDIGDAVTIVNLLVGKTDSFSRSAKDVINNVIPQ